MSDGLRLPSPDELSDDEIRDLVARRRALAERPLYYYRPHPKQALFHALGKAHNQRCLMAGNRQGKTHCGAAEAAMHATGLYPDWWEGHRFEGPTRGWVAGVTNEETRDVVQAKLFGPLEAPRTGMIPNDCIVGVAWHKGINDYIDTLLVRHVPTGGTSYISFKSYEQGWKKFRGESLDWAWPDEEPPEEIFDEIQARLIDRNGILWLTFTPQLGRTPVVELFFPEPTEPFRALVQMSLADALHIPKEQHALHTAKFKPHERKARIEGLPILGSGLVYPVQRELIEVDPFEVPSWWPRIAGIDFGYRHPTAVAWCAYNRENDRFYVYDTYRVADEVMAIHADAIRARPQWIPLAWPHDGAAHDKGGGTPLALQYAEKGARMLGVHAHFPDGSNSLYAGVDMILDHMKTGRFKVFSTCSEFWDEVSTYHMDKGKIVEWRDDVMDAVRYAWMMRRFATTEAMASPEGEERLSVGEDYDPLGSVH